MSEGCQQGVSLRWDLHYVETLEDIDLTVDPREAAPMVHRGFRFPKQPGPPGATRVSAKSD